MRVRATVPHPTLSDDRGRPGRRGGFSLRGGFTLIELVVVMVLVGIMSGIAIPTLRSLSATRLGVAQRQLARDITYARERAIASGMLHRVVLDAGGLSYSVVTVAGTSPSGTTTTPIVSPGSGVAMRQTFGSGDFLGVSITSIGMTSNQVTFDWRGVPWIGSSSTWTLGVGDVVLNGTKTVRVREGTGLVEVF